jgi:hypothetical protein
MKKANKIMFWYLLLALPFHIIFISASLLKFSGAAVWQSAFVKISSEALMWNFLLWFAVLYFIMAELLVNESFRSEVFAAAARFAGVKEQDERESMAVDKAGRYAFISTLALLVVMLFFLSLNINIGNLPPEKVKDGKAKYVTVGFGIALTDAKNQNNEQQGDIFTTSWFGPSKWSLVAIIMGWHILGFLVFLRRQNKYIKEP